MVWRMQVGALMTEWSDDQVGALMTEWCDMQVGALMTEWSGVCKWVHS